MRISVYAATDIGCIRKQNQDGFYINGVSVSEKDHYEYYTEIDSRNITISLMDGIACTENGSEAVNLLAEYFKNTDFSDDLEKYISDGNEYVINKASCDTGTTVAGFYVVNNKIRVFNVGDSKIFILNNGYLMQISSDDVMDCNLKIKQPLIQCIGKKRYKYDFHITDTESGLFLLCSDGLTDMVDTDEIESVFSEYSRVDQIGKALIDIAIAKGGYDNITVIVIGECQ